LWRHLWLRFLQPTFQLAQDRQALFLTTNKTLFVTGVLEFTLDAVQLIDYCQCDIAAARLAFRLYFLCIDGKRPPKSPCVTQAGTH
jgi:hypothetical protein